MATALNYPGVYVEEIPSGVRTITGVSTSVTAFIGRALRGSVNEPVVINSYADFERVFGGLWLDSHLGYAVRDFYLNGGSQAVIVRVHKGASKTIFELETTGSGTLKLTAINEGKWANDLEITVDTTDVSEEIAERYSLSANDLFNLTIVDSISGATEQFNNLTIEDSPRRIDNVLLNQSRLLRVDSLPSDIPIAVAKAGPIVDAEGVQSGGDGNAIDSATIQGSELDKTGLYALEKTDIFNLLCIPPYTDKNSVDPSVLAAAASYCEKRRAFLLIDAPSNWVSKEDAKAGISKDLTTKSKNAALFFPRIKQANPLRDNQIEEFAPCGAIAGTIARIDAQRGIWKAPAGLEATLTGVTQLSVSLSDAENGELNPLGINCLRTMPAAGPIIWGARTLEGNDKLASEWKYISVRRLALYIEETLYRGTHWVVFEPNDEPLWLQIRTNLNGFMNGLFRQGAFQGKTTKEAYFVKCDKETTIQDDVDRGIVNILIGFAPLKPAEFVVIKLQQIAGQN